MLTRLTHSAIAFAITVVVYQAYVLLAAPLIDPQVANQAAMLSPDSSEHGAQLQPKHKYRQLLAAYFPPGHWTLTTPPITAENDRTMIVLDEFKPNDNGQVRVKKCAILFFPHGRVRGELPPTDAVVLEAPQGAVLQMDNSFKRGVTSMGRLQWGTLIGNITVDSKMNDPGPQDDLHLVTSNVQIRENLIYTDQQVTMQLGPHRGSGRELEIRLAAVEGVRAPSGGPNLGGIESLVVSKEVQAEISPGNFQLGLERKRSSVNTDMPPIRVTCDGQFEFNFAKQVASFDTAVKLRQVHPTGELDYLFCDRLAANFATANIFGDLSERVDVGKLQLASLIATSSVESPVVLEAQSFEASARCERIWLNLLSRRISFDRGDRKQTTDQIDLKHERPIENVDLFYQGNEIHARQVEYELPPENSQQQVGRLLASGNGWLRLRTSDKPDADPFEARWSENMLLRRVNGRPILTLNGRPRLDMVGVGRLWSDNLDLYLREQAPDGSEDDLLPEKIVPERLVASGQIAIDSQQLKGQVKQLEVNFEYVPGGLQLGSAAGEERSIKRIGKRNRTVGGTRTYDINGDTLEMLVTVRDKEPEITSIDIDGQVVFSEAPRATTTDTTDKQPLKVLANHLRVEDADSPSAKITLLGKPATITASGMSIRTENLELHRGESRAWVDAPGQIDMLIDRDLSGRQLAAPQVLTIQWQRRMELNQNQITFTGSVRLQTAEGNLNTPQLIVTLSAPVQFDGAARQQRIDIAQLECVGGANAIFSQRDAHGLASVQTIRLEQSFRANLQSGELTGTGPGVIESVHLASASKAWGGLANTGGQPQFASTGTQPSSGQRLRFLGVEFNRGVRGNIDPQRGRRVEVYGDVEAVYGPVDAWEQRLIMSKGGMPGPDTIWITSESLEVAESPLARLQPNRSSGLGPLELLAKGNVTIEGPAGERGNFTTHSLLAKYDQLKRTFILEGNNQQPASMIYQEFRGGPTSPTTARKITYFQESGDVKVEGLMSGHLRQLGPNH